MIQRTFISLFLQSKYVVSNSKKIKSSTKGFRLRPHSFRWPSERLKQLKEHFPLRRPHGHVRNGHLIKLSLIPSNCVIRMDEIRLNTDRGGQRECLGLTIDHVLNRQSDGGQQHYCFMLSNEIPPLLLLQMNYVCVTVLICDRHPLWGNVGHTLMHNKGFRLYSHPQLGRLAPIFSSS